jgi:hypothetical protein
MNTKTSPPIKPAKKIRLTISVTPEVHASFTRLANAGNMSLGNAMGEWMSDTIEGVDYMAFTMERARAAPGIVMKEIHAYALGLADETGQLMRDIAEKGKLDRGGLTGCGSALEGRHGRPPISTPFSNTGGKVPPTTRKTKG